MPLLAAGEGKPWSGMPAGTVMGHVHLHVGDLTAAEAFYHAALGFDKVVWNYPGALFLSAGGYHHHLGTNTWSSNVPPADRSGAPAVVGPRGPVRRRRRSRGPEPREGRLSSRTPGRAFGSRADPWGTTVRLVRPLNREPQNP